MTTGGGCGWAACPWPLFSGARFGYIWFGGGCCTNKSTFKYKVVDPHWSGSIIFPHCGSGSSSESRVLMTKNWEKFTAVKLLYIFGSKIAIYLFLGLHKGHTSYRRNLQPSKENIQHFKTWKFFMFFYISGSFLPSSIRIRISKTDPDPLTRLNPDPIRIRIRIRNHGMNSNISCSNGSLL